MLDRMTMGLRTFSLDHLESAYMAYNDSQANIISRCTGLVMHSILGFGGALVTAVLMVPCVTFSASYIQFQGSLKSGKEDGGDVTIASRNINAIPFCRVGDGTDAFSDRFDGVMSTLQGKDVVMLQEAFGYSPYRIAAAYKNYHQGYGRSGVQFKGLESGLMILTTLKVLNFSYISLGETSNPISQGYQVLETRERVYINVHLPSGHEAKDRAQRMQFFKEIYTKAQSYNKPFVIAGDFNIAETSDREGELENMGLKPDECTLFGDNETSIDLTQASRPKSGNDLIVISKGLNGGNYEKVDGAFSHSDHCQLNVTVYSDSDVSWPSSKL